MIAPNLGIRAIMRCASEHGILIPAFNAAYIAMVKAVADALKECNTFGLIEVARPDVEKFGAESYAAVAKEFGAKADRRCMRLHLDHVPVIDEEGERVDWRALIQEGLDLKFDSVMIDGSRLELEENIAVTKQVCEMAHPLGVPVEAELGAVLGHEKGPLPPYEELFRTGRGFTRPEEAKRFVEETGVDWLSVAVGNIHGAISGAAKDQDKVSARLNIEHLRKLREATGVPLVLHGGSGVQRESILEGIRNGIAKINIGTDIRHAYERAERERPGDVDSACAAVKERVKALACEVYEIEGSAEKLAAWLPAQ